jgi:hypothetical protein
LLYARRTHGRDARATGDESTRSAQASHLHTAREAGPVVPGFGEIFFLHPFIEFGFTPNQGA